MNTTELYNLISDTHFYYLPTLRAPFAHLGQSMSVSSKIATNATLQGPEMMATIEKFTQKSTVVINTNTINFHAKFTF